MILDNHNVLDEYMKYLIWKKEYAQVCPLEQIWVCELCHKLYEKEGNHKLQQQDKIQDFLGFWKQQKCYGNDFHFNSTEEVM